jgi:transposase-like protein
VRKISNPGILVQLNSGGVVDAGEAMTTTRKQYSPRFKARVAIDAIRGEKTLSQLGSQFKVHPMQIARWRKAALEQLPEVFVGSVGGWSGPEKGGTKMPIGTRSTTRSAAEDGEILIAGHP